MQNTAPERGAGSDESTRRRIFGRMDPSSGLLRWSVRTCSSYGRTIDSFPRSRSSGSWRSSRSCRSRSSSSTVPMALCGSGRRRQRRPHYRAEAGACPLTRPAEPHPTGRQRVCGKAQSRLIDCCSSSTAAIVCVVRMLSISCTCAKVTQQKGVTKGRASEGAVLQ